MTDESLLHEFQKFMDRKDRRMIVDLLLQENNQEVRIALSPKKGLCFERQKGKLTIYLEGMSRRSRWKLSEEDQNAILNLLT